MDFDKPPSGGLSKGLLEQGCQMMNLKLFILLSYKSSFPENSLYVSFCRNDVAQQPPNLSDGQKHLFFVCESGGLAVVMCVGRLGRSNLGCSCGFYVGGQEPSTFREAISAHGYHACSLF